MIRKILKIIIVLFICSGIAAQTKTYTFDQCVEMAINRNLDLKIQQNEVKKASITTQQSKWNMAPSFSGSASSSLNFRRSTNQNNDIASGLSYNVGYSVGGSIVLFDGLTKTNTILANKFSELAYKEQTQQQINELYLSIAEHFANVLYIKDMITVSEEKLAINEQELDRITTNIDLGLLEQVAQLEIEATVSSNKLELQRLKNNLKLALLELSQLIDYSEPEEFDIDPGNFILTKPVVSSYTVTNVYDLACINLPEVRAKELQLKSMKKSLSVTKGNLYPSLSMYGGYSSGFYSTDTMPDGSKTPISSQFKNYLNPYLGMSLSVPIFYGFSTRFSIKRQKLNLKNTELDLENQKKSMKKQIETALVQLNALELEYEAAQDNLNYMQKYFENFREQYRLGLINSTDFNSAQNQLSQAKANVASARYSWIIQEKTIKIFTGETFIPVQEEN